MVSNETRIYHLPIGCLRSYSVLVLYCLNFVPYMKIHPKMVKTRAVYQGVGAGVLGWCGSGETCPIFRAKENPGRCPGCSSIEVGIE